MKYLTTIVCLLAMIMPVALYAIGGYKVASLCMLKMIIHVVYLYTLSVQ